MKDFFVIFLTNQEIRIVIRWATFTVDTLAVFTTWNYHQDKKSVELLTVGLERMGQKTLQKLSHSFKRCPIFFNIVLSYSFPPPVILINWWKPAWIELTFRAVAHTRTAVYAFLLVFPALNYPIQVWEKFKHTWTWQSAVKQASRQSIRTLSHSCKQWSPISESAQFSLKSDRFVIFTTKYFWFQELLILIMSPRKSLFPYSTVPYL